MFNPINIHLFSIRPPRMSALSIATERARITPTRAAALAERAAFTDGQILDAAELLFARHGLRGTRVREIAQADFISDAHKRRIRVKLLLFVNGSVQPAAEKQGVAVEKPVSQLSASSIRWSCRGMRHFAFGSW